jgi:hypothetical protein
MRNDDPFDDLIRSLEENLQRERRLPPPPRSPQPPSSNEPINPRRYLWILLPILILLSFGRILNFYTDWYWYDSLNLSSVFFTRYWSSAGLFAAGALVAFLFFAGNVLLARRLEPTGLATTVVEPLPCCWARVRRGAGKKCCCLSTKLLTGWKIQSLGMISASSSSHCPFGLNYGAG